MSEQENPTTVSRPNPLQAKMLEGDYMPSVDGAAQMMADKRKEEEPVHPVTQQEPQYPREVGKQVDIESGSPLSEQDAETETSAQGGGDENAVDGDASSEAEGSADKPWTLDEFTEAVSQESGLEVTPDFVEQLQVTVKADGKEMAVPLGDALRSYQTQQTLSDRFRKNREREKELETRDSQARGLVQDRVQALERAERALAQIHLGQMPTPEMFPEDMAAYNNALGDYNQKRQQFAQINQFVTAEVQKAGAEQARIDEIRRQQAELEDRQREPEMLIHWIDQNTASREKQELSDWAKSTLSQFGYDESVLAPQTTLDYYLLHYAKIGLEASKSLDATRKTIRTLPRRLPGQQRPKNDANVDKARTQVQKQGGTVDSIANLLTQRRLNR